MRVRVKRPAWILALAVCLGASAQPAHAQNLHNMIASDARVFPQVSGGIIAMRENAGKFYILANPAHSVQIFDTTGNKVGEFPAPGSGVTLQYAADLDIAPNGNIVVADRGANVIDVFAPDGSLKTKFPVFAPTSVVALSTGQIAVTTLRTEHPIEVFEQNGRFVRGFGEPHEISNPSPNAADSDAPPPLADTGRIIGDSADNLYFGVLSSTDPQIKKFDRFGYAAFSADVPAPTDLPDTGYDRVQVGFNFMRLTRSDQVGAWTTLGDSGKLSFGSNVGMGLAGLMSGNGHQGYGRGGGSGTIAGTITADTSLVQPMFDVHVGATTSNRATKGRGTATSATNNGQQASSSSQGTGTGNAATLQYFAPGTFSSSDDSSSTSDLDNTDAAAANATTSSSSTLQYQAPSSTSDPSNLVPGALNYMVGTPELGRGPGVGGFSSFFLGGYGPRPGGFGHPFLGGAGAPGVRFGEGTPGGASSPLTGSALGASSAANSATSGAGMPRPGFGGRGRFAAADMSFLGSLRINLDKPRPVEPTDKKLTAVGIDHQTQEFWAAIGSELVHFDKYGNAMDAYYLTTPDGTSLHITAIVVEPAHLFIGAGSGGVYEFARPDKTTSVPLRTGSAKIVKNPQ
jgi:hypothetical protein